MIARFLFGAIVFFSASLLTFWLWPWKPLQVIGIMALMLLGVGG
jgi:hypothetical protein